MPGMVLLAPLMNKGMARRVGLLVVKGVRQNGLGTVCVAVKRVWPGQISHEHGESALSHFACSSGHLPASAGLMTMFALQVAMALIWLRTDSPLLHRNCNRRLRRLDSMHESVQVVHCYASTAMAWDWGVTCRAISCEGIRQIP